MSSFEIKKYSMFIERYLIDIVVRDKENKRHSVEQYECNSLDKVHEVTNNLANDGFSFIVYEIHQTVIPKYVHFVNGFEEDE